MSQKIHHSVIMSNSSEELFFVLIDSELTVHDRITKLCSQANQKLITLAWFSEPMTKQKWHLLRNSYITSQLNYSLLQKINQENKKNLRKSIDNSIWWLEN